MSDYYLEEMRAILDNVFKCSLPYQIEKMSGDEIYSLANILLFDGLTNFKNILLFKYHIDLQYTPTKEAVSPEAIQFIFARLRNLYPRIG